MLFNREAVVLKVVVDPRGEVWCAEGRKAPSATGMSVNNFVRTRLFADTSFFRTDGHQDNVGLINEIYCGKADNDPAKFSLEVCSPSVWGPGPRISPEMALLRMMVLKEPSSTGGFCRMDVRMFCSYGIAASLAKSPEITPYVEWLIYRHPAWPAASFVRALEPADFAELVAKILDPRWYVDPDEPERFSRLALAMGLTNKVGRNVEIGRVSSEKQRNFCLLRRCWSAGGEPLTCGPRDFVWRKRGERALDLPDLVANKRFLNFFRLVWLDSLASQAFVGRLFEPGLFFDRPDEASAYVQHVRHHRAVAGS